MTDLTKSKTEMSPEGKAFVTAFTTFVLTIPLLPLRAWLFMLGIGAVHGALPAVPTVSFGAALLVLLGVSAVRGTRTGTK